MTTSEATIPVTLRCGFCLTLNRVDLAKAAQRPTCGDCSKPMLLDRPVKVTDEDFQTTVLESDAPVVVDFYADWCMPCQMVAPIMDELAMQNEGRLLVAKVDTDGAPRVAQQYGIRSIPTVIVFKGGKELERSVGFDPQGLRDMAARGLTS